MTAVPSRFEIMMDSTVETLPEYKSAPTSTVNFSIDVVPHPHTTTPVPVASPAVSFSAGADWKGSASEYRTAAAHVVNSLAIATLGLYHNNTWTIEQASTILRNTFEQPMLLRDNFEGQSTILEFGAILDSERTAFFRNKIDGLISQFRFGAIPDSKHLMLSRKDLDGRSTVFIVDLTYQPPTWHSFPSQSAGH